MMDINDFGIARDRGLDLVPVAAIVQRPLAAVIARDRTEVRTPARPRLARPSASPACPRTTPSSTPSSAPTGADPGDVRRVTIGFNAVAQLAAGKIDAATAFWNAEGVQLRDLGIPVREFRVDEFGAPRYPELLLVAGRGGRGERLADGMRSALGRGYELLGASPDAALDDLLEQVPELDRESMAAQLDALTSSRAFALGDVPATPQLDERSIEEWSAWAQSTGG